MILCFSGTGNSRYVAKLIAEKCDDELVSVNQLLRQEIQGKQGLKHHLDSPAKPFVLVCPAYAWRIPRVVEKFIRETSFTGRNDWYLIMTCGANTANAIGYFKTLCAEKGFVLKGFAEVIMPDNYLFMNKGVTREASRQIVEKSYPKIEEIAETLKAGATFPAFRPRWKFRSGFINDAFYALFVKAEGFHVNRKCTGCEECAQQCPLNNIKMRDNKPLWGDRCTHCLACICGCPAGAVEYKKKTRDKPRHFLKNY